MSLSLSLCICEMNCPRQTVYAYRHPFEEEKKKNQTRNLINFIHSFTATKKLPFEPFFVCINTEKNQFPIESFQFEHTTHQINYSDTKVNYIHDASINFNTTTKKTDEDNSTKECIANDMETLYWHTHGSMLWQR